MVSTPCTIIFKNRLENKLKTTLATYKSHILVKMVDVFSLISCGRFYICFQGSEYWATRVAISVVRDSIIDICDSIVDICDSIVDMCDSIVDLCDSIVDICDSIVDICDSIVDIWQQKPYATQVTKCR